MASRRGSKDQGIILAAAHKSAIKAARISRKLSTTTSVDGLDEIGGQEESNVTFSLQ